MQTLESMIRSSYWARDLNEAEIARAIAGSTERSFDVGESICRKGEPTDYWCGVIDGLTKMSNYSFEGKVVTLTGVAPGGWFGEGSLLKGELRRYEVLALQSTRVAFMTKVTFMWLLDHSIAFNRFLITQLNERLGQAFTTIQSERMNGPDARVASCVGSLFNPVLYPGCVKELRISQEELGYLTGLSRQRVNQALKRLTEAGLLRAGYGKVEILDLDGLRHFED